MISSCPFPASVEKINTTPHNAQMAIPNKPTLFFFSFSGISGPKLPVCQSQGFEANSSDVFFQLGPWAPGRFFSSRKICAWSRFLGFRRARLGLFRMGRIPHPKPHRFYSGGREPKVWASEHGSGRLIQKLGINQVAPEHYPQDSFLAFFFVCVAQKRGIGPLTLAGVLVASF